MGTYLNNLFKEGINNNLGNRLFLIGIFFLPSALPISVLFLLISLLLNFKSEDSFFVKDKWNIPLFISIGLILFSTLNISLINKPLVLAEYPIFNIWINLFNWIPIFLFYWGFQSYLKTNHQRLIFGKYLLIGSVPVIVSMILQKFFNIYGPFKTLFGLIVWFQKPLTPIYGVAGLFSNPNYAVTWLILILPFSILFIKKSNLYSIKKLISLIFFSLIIYMILLTASRNGIIGILLSGIFLFGHKKFLLITIPLVSLFSFDKIFGFLINKGETFYKLNPLSSLIDKLTITEFSNSPRLVIWESVLKRIQERPFLGWGPSTFSFLNEEHNEQIINSKLKMIASHSHNMPLEMAHNFGIPLSIILITTILLLLIKTWIYIFVRYPKNNEILVEKAWFSSSAIIFVSHLSDITYYDGKISILISLFFAGLKCINNENNFKRVGKNYKI